MKTHNPATQPRWPSTTPASISSVEQHVEFTRGSESMSTEVAGPVTTHPQQSPEGGHPPVGGHGVTGSADPLQVGVILRSPVNVQTPSSEKRLVLPML